MEFADRLDFLMNLTHTTNKQLGALLNVHPSQISRMRNGARGIPGNSEYIRIMSEHFAANCTFNYQRSALAEALGRPPLRLPLESNVLSVILSSWMVGGTENVGEKAAQYMNNYSAFGIESSAPNLPPYPFVQPHGDEIIAYYGEDGKRAAVSAFLDYLISLGEPHSIDITSDEDLGWLIDDTGFSEKVNRSTARLAELGCVARRIVRPISSLESSYTSFVQRWLQFYFTGHITSYFYPRLRDGVYHRTLLIVPGVAAVFSSSFGRNSKPKVTFFVRSSEVTYALESEFEDYLNLCQLHMIKYDIRKMPSEFFERLRDCDVIEASCIQRSNTLSTTTIPLELAAEMRFKFSSDRQLFYDVIRGRVEVFRELLLRHPFTDIICLAGVNDIIAGKVEIQAAATTDCLPSHYTLDTYLLHLKNILFYLNTFPNYHVYIADAPDDRMRCIFVKENRRAFLIRSSEPYCMHEINEYNLISTFSELLHRAIPNDKPDKNMRRSAIARIEKLISKLEEVKSKR